MIDFTTLETFIYNWMYDVLNIPIQYANENIERPTIPYATYNIVNVKELIQKPRLKKELSGDDVKLTYYTYNEGMLSFNFYYEGAYTKASILKSSLIKDSIKELFSTNEISVFNATSINRIPVEINEQWEERTQFDLYIGFYSVVEETIEQITNIGITNEINDEEFIVNK